MSGSNSDAFAASLRSWDMRNQPRNQTPFIGHLHDADAHKQIDLGWKSGVYDVTDIGWDGEAFAVHARDNANGDILVTRIDPAGRVILPLTKYGTTPSPGGTTLGYRMSTSSDSGMSYLFDAPGTGRYLSGHDRSGNPLPWTAARPLNLVIPGLAMADSAASHQAIAADSAGGAWVVWDVIGGPRLGAHVTSQGDVDWSATISPQSGFQPAITDSPGTKGLWAAGGDGHDILAVEVDGDAVRSPETIVRGPSAGQGADVWDVRDFAALEWRSERWLSFTEHSVFLHIVKIHAGCTYDAAFRPAQAATF